MKPPPGNGSDATARKITSLGIVTQCQLGSAAVVIGPTTAIDLAAGPHPHRRRAVVKNCGCAPLANREGKAENQPAAQNVLWAPPTRCAAISRCAATSHQGSLSHPVW